MRVCCLLYILYPPKKNLLFLVFSLLFSGIFLQPSNIKDGWQAYEHGEATLMNERGLPFFLAFRRERAIPPQQVFSSGGLYFFEV